MTPAAGGVMLISEVGGSTQTCIDSAGLWQQSGRRGGGVVKRVFYSVCKVHTCKDTFPR